MVEFLPLERRRERMTANGMERFVPALHAEWTSQIEWVSFVKAPHPITELHVPGAKETWLERADLVVDDLEGLLAMPYCVFWSQISFDNSLHKNLGRLLRRLPRPYDRHAHYPDDEIRARIETIITLSFRTFLRLSTYKESAENFMGAEYYSRLIYDKYLFDIPRIMDICSLYRAGNVGLVDKMVTNLFNLQPSYVDDLKACVPTIIDAMAKSVDRVDGVIYSRSRVEMEGEDFKKDLEDLVVYVADVSATLSCLWDTYEPAARIFNVATNGEIASRLASFYQNGLAAAHNFISKQHGLDVISDGQREFAESRLLFAKKKILTGARSLVVSCFIAPILEGQKQMTCENFLDAHSAFLSEPAFYTDYSSAYSLDDDLDVFRASGVEVDNVRVDYLKNGRVVNKKGGEVARSPAGEVAPRAISREKSPPAVYPEEAIARVVDLFPDMGKGFVNECLKYYGGDEEKVINACLEENLPPHLIETDRKMKLEPAQEKPAQPEVIGKLDTAGYHRGKKAFRGHKNANALLDDKSHVDGALREKFSALGIVSDEIFVAPHEDNDYDDEYDDTYDENAIGEREPDALEVEAQGGRQFVLPRALGGGHVAKEKKFEDEVDGEYEDEVGRPRLDFVRNPEEVRAEAERKRQAARLGKRPPHRDVVGKAKGQGQDKQVLINRSRKNANKNKHQRAMADKKQSKGMF